MAPVTDAVRRPRLAGATWPDLPDRPLLLVPLGAVEQHGHHLPLATDTTVACAVAEAAAGDLDGALLAPALAYGASGEHEDFPGTVSIGTEALTGLLVEYGRSASRWAGRLVLVNGHGDRAGDGGVGGQRQVVAVLLDGPERHQQQRALGQVGPGGAGEPGSWDGVWHRGSLGPAITAP